MTSAPRLRGRRDLGDVQGREHRGDADAHAAEEAVTDKVGDRSPNSTYGASSKNRFRNQSSALISGVSTEPSRRDRFRVGRAEGRHQEQHAGDEQAAAAAEVVRHAPPRAPPMRQPNSAQAMVKPSTAEPRAFGQAEWRDEIRSMDSVGAGDDGGVVAEQQAAECGDDASA